MSIDTARIALLTEEERRQSLGIRRKSEILDWKKIALVDLEKVIQTADLTTLEDLLHQIAYCRPEIEFDSVSSDSGFIKVFKLSQLIIINFHHSYQLIQDKYQKLNANFLTSETLVANQVKEIQNLKESLSAAKKELRRRKELLANAQSEVMGENKDELDPCPYCSKRFLTAAYLLSHIQRRHQGLPLHPAFPPGAFYQGFAPKFVENSYNSKQLLLSPGQPPSLSLSPREVKVQATQTDLTPTSSVIPSQYSQNPQEILALVEKCVQEKLALLDNAKAINTNNSNNVPLNIPVNKTLDNGVQTDDERIPTAKSLPEREDWTEEEGSETVIKLTEETGASHLSDSKDVKEIVAEIKHHLDLQWQYFSGKIPEQSMDELKALVVVDPDNPENIKSFKVIPSPMMSPMHLRVPAANHGDIPIPMGTSAESKILEINDAVEDRFQKQQKELDALKSFFQTKMDMDIRTIEGKLEAQERYWRSKLRLVEEDYGEQMRKLRQEVQASLEHQSVGQVASSIYGRVLEQKFLGSDNGKVNQNNHFHNNNNNIPQSHPPMEPPLPAIERKIGTDSVESIVAHSGSDHYRNANAETGAGEAPASHIGSTSVPNNIDNMTKPSSVNVPEHPPPLQQPRMAAKSQEEVPEFPLPNMKPVAKPRSIQTSLEKHETEEVKVNPGGIIAVKSAVERDEYEEPDEILKLDEVEEYSETASATSQDLGESVMEDDNNNKSETNQKGSPKKKLDLRMVTEEEENEEKIAKIRGQVTQEITEQLKALGIDGNEEIFDNEKKMQAVIKELQTRRESLHRRHSSFGEIQTQVVAEVGSALEGKNFPSHLALFSGVPVTPEKTPKSPLVKLFSAVKLSGKKMRKKVKSAITRNPKPRKPSPTLVTPKNKPSKGGFFSRERWSGKKKGGPNNPKQSPPPQQNPDPLEDHLHQSEDSGSSTDSESSATSSSEEPPIQVHYVPKDKAFLTSTPVKKSQRTLSRTESQRKNVGEVVSSEYETEDDEEEPQQRDSPHAKKKFKVKNNKAAKLRYKEAARRSSLRQNSNGPEYAQIRRTSGAKPLPEIVPTGGKIQKDRLPVRRSLKAELDQVTPTKPPRLVPAAKVEKAQESSEEEIATGDDISSSWDEHPHHKPQHHQKAGEAMVLTPSKYTIERTQSPENSPSPQKPKEAPRRKGFLTKAAPERDESPPGEKAHPYPSQALQKLAQRPKSARPRIVTDSWDLEDEDEADEDKPAVTTIAKSKPSFVTERWNDKPLYPAASNRRIPMNVVDQKQGQGSNIDSNRKNAPPSPLNNSWDEN